MSIHSAKGRTAPSRRNRAIERQCYLLLALPLIGFFVFQLYPILWSMGKSFFYYNQIPSETKFVGLQNFITIFTKDSTYWKTWITTLELTVLKLPFEMFFTLILAVLLSKKIKGAPLMRLVYFMPNVISAAISAVIFSNLFQYFGFFNEVLMKIGMITEPIDWFATKAGAMTVLVVGNVWACFGINVLYFSSALTNVPDELYEAAEIDGANAFRKFWSITLPMIAPVFQTILLMAINGTLHISEFVLVMTNGAPAGTTHTVGSYVLANFVPGFAKGTIDIGYGCAISLVNSIIYGIIAIVYNKASDKLKNVY